MVPYREYMELQEELIQTYKELTKAYKKLRWMQYAFWAYRFESVFHPIRARKNFITIHKLLRSDTNFFFVLDEIGEEIKSW